MPVERLPAEIVTVGNEILSGRTVDTNAAEISQGLDVLGIPVARVTTVGDDADDLAASFAAAAARARVVIVTGGLGPTHDDITRRVFCDFFGMGLRHDTDVLANIERLFERRGRTLTDRNIDQANVPERAEALMNPIGTAPGVYLEDGDRHWFVLPGVPREMRGLLAAEVMPRLKRLAGAMAIARRDLYVVGLPESRLMDRIAGVDGLESVASLPDEKGEVTLRISVAAEIEDAARARADAIEAALRERLGERIYGADGDTLESVVGGLLRAAGSTIAVAESCTGGLLASRLTDVPGSSDYFTMGLVTYANQAKIALLGVPRGKLERRGAVSKEVAVAMARGARSQAKSDLSVALTGIAGPGGGTAEKPVGLVHIALAHADGEDAAEFRFGAERLVNKQRAVQTALDMVRRHLLARRQAASD